MLFSSIIICLSAFIPEHDAKLFERAIWERGYASYYMTHSDNAADQNCTDVIYSAEGDLTYPAYMFYDGEVNEDTGVRPVLTQARASDLLLAWTAYQRPATLTDLVLEHASYMGAELLDTLTLSAEVDGLCSNGCDDGVSNVLDALAEEGVL
jgi:hypothetical protein